MVLITNQLIMSRNISTRFDYLSKITIVNKIKKTKNRKAKVNSIVSVYIKKDTMSI